MALPTDVTTGTLGHAGLHNNVNAEVNRLAAYIDGQSLGTSDLDTITTPGDYLQATDTNATLARHYPVATLVYHLQVRAVGARIIQTIRALTVTGGAARMWVREYNASWGSWVAYSPVIQSEVVGRTISVWDPVQNRAQLIWGDTGLRDITTVLAGLSTPPSTLGTWYLRRTTFQVHLMCTGVGNTAAAEVVLDAAIPTGWRPATASAVGLAANATPTGVRMLVNASGQIRLAFPASLSVVAGSLSWPTVDAWPAATYGTAVGTVPVG